MRIAVATCASLLELEAIEPNLFLALADGAADRFAAAILAERMLRPDPRAG